MTKTVHINVEGYGEVKVPLPPKTVRKNSRVLADMVEYTVVQTMNLVEEKTIGDFRSALDAELTPHKHFYKLTEHQLEYHATWVCECSEAQCVERDDLYPILKGEVHGEIPGVRY